ncbi:MAG: hypothetical protein PHZ26_06060 [Candidatus Gracilibacteria bacterium]|nr:hypothetical protein [Candidatus Gracilibacteria bacterium]
MKFIIFICLCTFIYASDVTSNMFNGVKYNNQGNQTKALDYFKKACDIDGEATGCQQVFMFSPDKSVAQVYKQKACNLDSEFCK